MSLNNKRANEIKKIALGGSYKDRANTTNTTFKGLKSPHRLPINNSLLTSNERERLEDIQPLRTHFEQMFEETHYMYPKKNKSRIRAIEEEKEEFEDKILQREADAKILQEIRSRAENSPSAPELTKNDKANKAELDFLLQKSLKYHKEKVAKKKTSGEELTDEERLDNIMQTWLTNDPHNLAHFKDYEDIEMTTNMILNTKNNKDIYPDEIKGAEIDIYLRNRKNVPKYELLQYMQFSTNDLNSPAEDSPSAQGDNDQDGEKFDLNIGCANPLTNSRLLLSFKLKCEFLDHVTPDFASPEHLPHSIFDDCSNEIDKILGIIKEKKKNNDFLWAISPYINEDGSMIDCKVKVLEYDFDRGEFLVEFDDKYKHSELRSYDFQLHKDINRVSKLRKYCCRSNLQMEYEDSSEAAARKEMVANRRHEAQNQLNCEKAFINELANKYDYVKMDRRMKENIKKKLLFNLNTFEPHTYISNLCIQVETLYIFSILKSLLFSQYLDKNIQKIVTRYRIYEVPKVLPPFYALQSYEVNGGPVEKMLSKNDARIILKEYSLLGRQCYINAILDINIINDLVLNGELFCHPLSYEVMYPVLKNDTEYKEVQFEEIDKIINQYPIDLSDYIRVWQSVNNCFKKNVIKTKWAGGITKIVEDVIYKQFDSKMIIDDLRNNSLNPYIIKLFEVCRLRMETQLAEKYFCTLEIYLRTLIRFVARDTDFHESNPQYFEQGIDQYDKDIHFNKPMIKTVVKIKKYKDREEGGSKYMIYTKPSLMSICKDLFNVTNVFLNTLSGIKRIDEDIFPQIELNKNILRSPDQKVDKKLVLIAACINYAKERPQEQIKAMKKYTNFLEITPDSMILSMKKRSYEKYESNADSDYSSKKGNSIEEAEGEMSDEIISEDNEDAYKNIEITNEVYIEEFTNLRGAFWDVQRYVKNFYDFGLIQMDCTIFLKNILKHLDKLIKHLTQHLRSDARVNHILLQYEAIEQRVSSESNSIDEVIYLIEYIDNIRKPGKKLEELQNKIDQAKQRKDFLDDLFIDLNENDFSNFLKLLIYPRNLNKLLDKRRDELENERSRLSKMMNHDIKEINETIKNLKQELEDFRNIGMYFRDKKQLQELNLKISDGSIEVTGFSRDLASKIQSGVNSSVKSGDKNDSKKEISEIKKVEVFGDFDSIHIESYSSIMEKLKEKIDTCQQR